MENKLYLGIAREVITPPLGTALFGYHPNVFAQEVHDDLTLTVFAFQQGEQKALMLSAFVCSFDTGLSTGLRNLLADTLGVPADNIILSAVHTHCGPSLNNSPGWGGINTEYFETIFQPAALRAAKAALDAMEPVQMATASGQSLVGINRRQLNPDNTISLGQNPWGPFNPEMYLLSFRTEKKVLANMIWYGAHLTSAGCIPIITRDWAGPMVDAVEAVSGAITAFFNGPEGDVGPRLSNGGTTGNIDLVEELGAKAAADALRIYTTLGPYQDATLAAYSTDLQIPLKKRISYEEAIANYDPAQESAVNWAKRRNEYFRKVKDSYAAPFEEKDSRPIQQTLIRIGDVVFAAFPMELFSEVGMRIDQAEKDYKVLSLSNTNGSYSYFPTQDQLCRGGYEIGMFLYGDVQLWVEDADYHIMAQTLQNVAAFKK